MTNPYYLSGPVDVFSHTALLARRVYLVETFPSLKKYKGDVDSELFLWSAINHPVVRAMGECLLGETVRNLGLGLTA